MLAGLEITVGRSTDNVRSKMVFVRSNVWLTGHFVRWFNTLKKNNTSERFVRLNKVGNYSRS